MEALQQISRGPAVTHQSLGGRCGGSGGGAGGNKGWDCNMGAQIQVVEE